MIAFRFPQCFEEAEESLLSSSDCMWV